MSYSPEKKKQDSYIEYTEDKFSVRLVIPLLHTVNPFLKLFWVLGTHTSGRTFRH